MRRFTSTSRGPTFGALGTGDFSELALDDPDLTLEISAVVATTTVPAVGISVTIEVSAVGLAASVPNVAIESGITISVSSIATQGVVESLQFPDVSPSSVAGTGDVPTAGTSVAITVPVVGLSASIPNVTFPVYTATVSALAFVPVAGISATIVVESVGAVASIGFSFSRNGIWKFVDYVTDETYEFEIGPSEESVEYNKSILYQTTLGPERRTLIAEEQDDIQELRISGTILTQQQYETFVDWYERRNQILVVDDLGRQFTVYIRAFEPKRERKPEYPWFHTYTMNAVMLPS